jgi:hypothetical protein
MGFFPIYKSDKGTHQGLVSRGLQEVLSDLGRKTLPFVYEGHFSNFIIFGQNFKLMCWGRRSGFQLQILGFNWSK